MPGGLKENVELYLDKSIRIDKSEGQSIVYKALESFSKQDEDVYPAVFDVLNCQEGCNLGTGCNHEYDIFEINTIMDDVRQSILFEREKADFEALFEDYDEYLNLGDFIRTYKPLKSASFAVSTDMIEDAMLQLGKTTDIDRNFDCSACGADTCYEMAKQIAGGFNVPCNCIQKVRHDIDQRTKQLSLSSASMKNIEEILKDITIIRELSTEIITNASGVNQAIDKFNDMAKGIEKIALQINLISLNASIEAVRAGEYGKAFLVVAEEIRRLASSSKDTVSESEEIIKEASESIQSINAMISRISEEVDKAFTNILEISKKTKETLEMAGIDI
jgi:hypothetical protein